MQFGGRYLFAVERRRLWEALNDVAVLKATIPGCTRAHCSSAFSSALSAERYTLSGRGKGGILGLAHGAADIELSDDGTGTILSFTATGGASGRIMSLGKALIGGQAQKVIDGFFVRFAEAMGAEMTPLPHATAESPST